MRRLLCAALTALSLLATSAQALAEPPSPGPLARPQLTVDLNQATEHELVQLPGIGPARAQAILAFRARYGPFRRISQLLRVRGIGRATLRRLRPFLVLAPPARPPPPAHRVP